MAQTSFGNNNGSVYTNCGNLELSVIGRKMIENFQNGIKATQPTGVTANTIKRFSEYILSSSKSDNGKLLNDFEIPLKSKWILIINPVNRNNLLAQIENVSKNFEPGQWDVTNQIQTVSQDRIIGNAGDTIGCIFAQGVTLPGENVKFDYAGITEASNRGFINAPIITGRTDFEPLEVGFLETNSSFVDTFLRPWSIAVAHKGLIAYGPSIKADIIVHQLGRSANEMLGSKLSPIRKTFHFRNCAPINISSETIDYSTPTDYPKMQAKFSYTDYYITDSSTNSR